MRHLATAMTLSAMTALSGPAAAGAANAATGPVAHAADGGFPAGQFSISTDQGKLCLSGEAFTKNVVDIKEETSFSMVVRKALLRACTGDGSQLWTYNAAKRTLVNVKAGKGIGEQCLAMSGKVAEDGWGKRPALLVLRGCTSDWRFLAKPEQDNIVCHEWKADADGHIGCATGGHRWTVLKNKKGVKLPVITNGGSDVWKLTSVGG